jgi:hypothetical protein
MKQEGIRAMKQYTFNIKANLDPVEKAIARIAAIQKELSEIMAEYVEAVNDLCAIEIPLCFDPAEEEPEEEKDIFAISPYEYPDEFNTEEDFDPFDFGADKEDTPFANVDDIEGLG